MLKAGLLEETEALLAEGLSPELPALQSIGYREAVQFLHGDLARAYLPERINAATRQFARRQLTWFRRMPGIRWLPANDPAAVRRYVADSFAASV